MTVSRRQRGKIGGALHFLKRDLQRHWGIYVMFIPVFVYFVIFHYLPLYGAQIAFKDYIPIKGIEGSKWVGLKHFYSFFNGL